jgi:isopentenyl diphosphate isomerase/L-lactate dehydrogenase-like FMN-dependent dehydrogenase
MAETEQSPDSSTTNSPGMQRQLEVYQKGLLGQRPSQPVSIDELEQKAKTVMTPGAYAYVAGGAGSEDSVRANRDAFRRWRIVPHFLRNVAQRDLSVSVLGQRFPAPLLIAPIGVQSIIHRDAELAVARAARSLGVPIVLSTLSSQTMEAVAQASGPGPRWFQLYWPKNSDLTASFLARAERAGYGAVVVTLDTYLLGWRERDIQLAYLPFLQGEGLANFFSDPVFLKALKDPPQKDPVSAIRLSLQVLSNPSLTWSDIPFLRRHTRLPILLKGILDPDDARKALDAGVDGVIVSNHGGRQLDGAVAALDALPRIVKTVGDRMPVLFDSGIRRGADVFKAVALGARAVLLGRPYCWGLAVNGEQGVHEVLLNLLADIDLTLGLAGCSTFAEVQATNLVDTIPEIHSHDRSLSGAKPV